MLCLWPDQMPTGPAGPPNPLACYQLTMLAYHYQCGNPPEPSLSGRSSMSAWLGGLGGIVRKGVWMPGIIFHADKSVSRNWEIFWQDDHWYPWILIHSWEKSQCKKYLSHYFFLITDLIKIDVSDNFVNLSEHFQANDWRFELWEKDTRECAVITVLWQVSA